MSMNKSINRAHRWEYEDELNLSTIGAELFKGGWRTSDKERIQEEEEFTNEEMKIILKVMEELEIREIIEKRMYM